MSTPTTRRDAGMTLVELLVSVAILGSIIVVLTSAVVVTIRQQPETQSRVDVARWEQALALWLPADLSSATNVSVAETDVPCPSPDCAFGSNALQLTWDDGSGPVAISYRYGPADDGNTFVLRRVACKDGSCTNRIILRDLAVPSDDDGNPIAWADGDQVPDTVINVTVPLAVGSSDPSQLDNDTRAQRVIVNVNGSPGNDGLERSSTVSFTAGGSTLGSLEPATFSGPSFLQANSGCGGPITLVVDKSGSISNSDMVKVRAGVTSFIEAFEGTPTQLQIVTFSTYSEALGTGSWNRYFDLADPNDVDALIGPGGLVGTINRGGGTNWEDALYRTFYAEDGQTYEEVGDPTRPTPEMVVFFTDGEPTLDRTTYKSGGATTYDPGTPPTRFDWSTAGNTYYGSDFSPRGWWRADAIVEDFASIRFIGVGVGTAFDDTRRVWRSGWPTHWRYRNIPREVFLGDLAAGGDPSRHGTPSSGAYVLREWNSTDGWGDVSNANLLVTNDMNQFGGALTQIALAECGGTLTVQTRDTAGVSADADVTYQVGQEVVTTTRIAKAATFDIPLEGIPSATVQLVPQSLEGTGYTPVSWNCRAGGSDLVNGSDYTLVTPGTPGDGIDVTVGANQAVACTLTVTR